MPGHDVAPPQKLVKKPVSRSNRKRATLVRFLMTTIVTTTMITTGGFGTFPPNELTENSARLISENFPPEIIQPVNLVLEQAAAPTLEVIERPDSPGADTEIVDFFESLVEPIFTALPEASAEPGTTPEALTATLENGSPTFESSATSIVETTLTVTEAFSPSPTSTLGTSTPLPSETILPSATATPLPTWTYVFLPPAPTKTRQPPPADTATPLPTATPTSIPPTLTPTPTSCAAGLALIASSPYSATDAFQATWDGLAWAVVPTPNWGTDTCNLPTYNNSGTDITITFRYASNQCASLPVTAGGGVQWVSGSNTAGQCPVELYAPLIIPSPTPSSTPIPPSCAAGLNLIYSAPFSLTDAFEAHWNGTTWNITTIPNWSTVDCNLPTYNDSGTDITITRRIADNTCASFTVPASGGVIWVSGNDTLGQCPVELYTP